MTCEFASLDGAYVLGSLSPAERADYERHLGGCDECSRSVRELAGLPGLLARVPADVLESPPDRESVPGTLLPSVVAAARRDQRRRTTRTTLLAAAAVAVIASGSVAVGAALDGDETPVAAPSVSAPTTAPPQQMRPVGHSRSSGWVSLTPVTWGTRLDLTCTYESAYGGDGPWTYTLVVRTTDGRDEVAATWDALPGKELRVPGAVSVPPEEIARVEVRTADGYAVLRLTP